MKSDPIVSAVCSSVIGVAVVMTVFTYLDLGSGDRSLALALGAGTWPLIAVLGSYMLVRLNRLTAEGDSKNRQD